MLAFDVALTLSLPLSRYCHSSAHRPPGFNLGSPTTNDAEIYIGGVECLVSSYGNNNVSCSTQSTPNGTYSVLYSTRSLAVAGNKGNKGGVCVCVRVSEVSECVSVMCDV